MSERNQSVGMTESASHLIYPSFLRVLKQPQHYSPIAFDRTTITFALNERALHYLSLVVCMHSVGSKTVGK